MLYVSYSNEYLNIASIQVIFTPLLNCFKGKIMNKIALDNNLSALMLGWEFPPYISGGLGTACYGLTRAMDKLGMQTILILPKLTPLRFGDAKSRKHNEKSEANFLDFNKVKFHTVSSYLQPYTQAGRYENDWNMSHSATIELKESANKAWSHHPAKTQIYGSDMLSESYRYALQAAKIAEREDFDIIHAHDWMTFPAALLIAQLSGKPLIVHIHSTEFDRSGENVDQRIYDIERYSMQAADTVVTVSNYTKNIITNRYLVPSEKVEVVYNGVDYKSPDEFCSHNQRSKIEKIVLFLGRITMQKGPEYFLYAAKRVLEKLNNVKFIMAGAGDMFHRSVELTAELGIGHKVLFTHFLRGDDVDKAYRMADLYVMPSVSEPFGIAPLEAMRNNVPVLISKQSGISEILFNALKVDFWDINQMANKIISVLRFPALHKVLQDNGSQEIYKFRWEDSAARINNIYKKAVTIVNNS